MLTFVAREVFSSDSPDRHKRPICLLAYCVDMRLETQVLVIECNTKVSDLMRVLIHSLEVKGK